MMTLLAALTTVASAAPAPVPAAPGLKLLKANLTREGWHPEPLGEFCLSARTAGYFTARAVQCNPTDLSQQWTYGADGSITNKVGSNGMRLFVNFNLLLTETNDVGHTWHSSFHLNNLTSSFQITDGGSTFCLYAQPGANDKYFMAGFMVTLVMVEAPGTKVAINCGDHNSVWSFVDI